jgi:hypothetical protein
LFKKKSIGIIGIRGIGKIYFRELSLLGVKKIYILGKSYINSLKNKLSLQNESNVEIIPCKSIKDFKNKKLDIICVCSPTNTHLNYINKFLKTESKLIVEKPLFDLKNLSDKEISLISENLFNKYSKKIITNLPLIEYANSLKTKFKINKKKIKKINFKYYTSGKNFYKDIATDLLPHSLSFLLFFFMIKKDSIKINSKIVTKNSWKSSFAFNKINCTFDFNENINRKNSILKISINDKNYLRVQKNNKSRLIKNHEYIKSKNLYKKINNSMSSSIKKNLLKLTENKISKKDINFQKSLVSLMSFFIK